MRRATAFAIVISLCCWVSAQEPADRPDSFRFAVIGDSGTGGRHQYEVGARLAEFQQSFPFRTVVMLGDNIYGSDTPKDYRKKFELPYKALLDAGVKFHAALGNHDSPNQSSYKLFNMDGKRYYTFKPHDDIRFFSLDTSLMDRRQLEWIEKELDDSGSKWKIAYLHHPLYSSGARHGSDLSLRRALEPLFVKYGVSVVLAGHDHFYERIKPQRGIHHFVVGGSAKLRAGNVVRSNLTAASFDRDNSFAVMEINGDTLHFKAISRSGKVVDSGSFERPFSSPGQLTGRPVSSP